MTADLKTRARAADPVRDDAFEGWTLAPDGRATFRQIVETPPAVRQHAPAPARTIRRRPAVLVAAVAAATLIAVLMPVATDGPSGTAIASERRDGMIYLKVTDASADPEAMTRDLRAAGIDGEVVTIPVVPSYVGRWIEAEYDSRRTAVLESPITEQAGAGVEVLEIPADFSTWIRLKVGRPAEAGETYAENAGANELRADGALTCLGLEDMAPPEARDLLAGYGYETSWAYNQSTHADPPPTGEIYAAWFAGPTDLRMVVDVSGGAEAAAARASGSHGRPSGIDGPCE
jgi:hypothetical protein